MNTADQNGNETSRKEWFYRVKRGNRVGPLAGPFTLEELRGRLTADDYAWKKGMSDWMRAGDIGELATLFHTRKAEEERTTTADHSQGTTEPSTKVPAGGNGDMIGVVWIFGATICFLLVILAMNQFLKAISLSVVLVILLFLVFGISALVFCGIINAQAVELTWMAGKDPERVEGGWLPFCAKVFFFLAGISTGGIVFAIEMLIVVLAAKGKRGKKVEKEASPSGQESASATP